MRAYLLERDGNPGHERQEGQLGHEVLGLLCGHPRHERNGSRLQSLRAPDMDVQGNKPKDNEAVKHSSQWTKFIGDIHLSCGGDEHRQSTIKQGLFTLLMMRPNSERPAFRLAASQFPLYTSCTPSLMNLATHLEGMSHCKGSCSQHPEGAKVSRSMKKCQRSHPLLLEVVEVRGLPQSNRLRDGREETHRTDNTY